MSFTGLSLFREQERDVSVYPLVNKGAYSQVDAALSEWAMARGVRWFTEYQDYEVRTFFVGEGKTRAQVAVDPPVDGLVRVHAAQRVGRRDVRRFDPPSCAPADLAGVLDEALGQAKVWISSAART